MGWTVFTWIFGIACIVGPLLLIVWYARAFKKRLKELNDKSDR